MNNKRSFLLKSGRINLLGVLCLLPLLQGCNYLQAPEPEMPPAKPKPPAEWVFDPKDGNVSGQPLTGTGGALPEAYVITADGVFSGDIVAIRSKKGNTLGATADTVHLAGIITPRRGEKGFEDARRATLGWVAGKDLAVEQDKTFPTDVEGRRLVAIKFKADENGPNKGNDLVLNRMLVRNGYALVDLYSPTSFDTREWLKDEAFARRFKRGLWQQPDVFRVLQQRLPLPASSVTKVNVKVTAGGTAPAAAAAAAPTPAPEG